MVEDFLRDVRYGVRLLFRTRAFAIVAILTLGLGIGAATAVFSVVGGVLLRPLPYPDPDRVVRLHQVDGSGRRTNTVSEPNFEDWKSGTRTFSAMAEMSAGPTPVTIGGEATMTQGAGVSCEFFDVMGVRPLIGRGFLPDEQRVGLISSFPLGGGSFANGRFIEMTRPNEITSLEDFGLKLRNTAGVPSADAGYRVASEGYFAAMGIPLIRGRLFEVSDGPDAPHVAVISESLANARWPGQDAIGRFVQFGNMDGDLRGFRIVGIVGDVREISPEAVPGSIFYGCYQQRPMSRVGMVVRTSAPPALTTPARQIIRTIDPAVPLQVRTVEDAFDRALAGRRFSLLLIGVFSGCALVLATLGVYGLMAYLVSQRTREIGIRLALGAESTDVVALIVGRGMRLAVIGVTIGSLGALGLTRLLDGMLFGVSAVDPIAFAGVITLTLTAVLAATWVPARRAVKVAPVEALRAD